MKAKNKLYFIACCFPPIGRGNAITNSCVANALSHNMAVDVVCMKREEGGIIAYQEDASLKRQINPDITVHRIRAANWWKINMALYVVGILPCYFVNWAWSVWRRREEIFSEKGIIFAVYPVFSDLLVGYLISRRYNMPLLVDFRDDFSGVMARGWQRMLRPLYRFLESHIIQHADKISVTTEHLRRDLIKRYNMSESKVSVVYNIVPPSSANISKRNVKSNTLRVIYAGAMSRVQKPEILLKGYNVLCRRDAAWATRLSVELYGPESPYFKLKIKQLVGEGCYFGGFLPQAVISKRVASADIGFFSLADSIYAYATPTKLFDYIEAGIPILASLPLGAARDIINQYAIGLTVDVGDVEGVAECLERLAASSSLRAQFRENCKEAKNDLKNSKQIDKWKVMINEIAPTI